MQWQAFSKVSLNSLNTKTAHQSLCSWIGVWNDITFSELTFWSFRRWCRRHIQPLATGSRTMSYFINLHISTLGFILFDDRWVNSAWIFRGCRFILRNFSCILEVVERFLLKAMILKISHCLIYQFHTNVNQFQ